jgi:hypothetical protein
MHARGILLNCISNLYFFETIVYLILVQYVLSPLPGPVIHMGGARSVAGWRDWPDWIFFPLLNQSITACPSIERVAGLGFSFPSSKRKVTTCPSILFFPFHGQSQHYKLLTAPGCSSQSPYLNKKNKSRARGPRRHEEGAGAPTRHKQEQGARRLDDGW